jgi:hypothetical protein
MSVLGSVRGKRSNRSPVRLRPICRTVHRAPLLRRIRPLLTLRAQIADHYISRTGIMMRSSQYAAPRQDADTGEG